MTAGISSSGSSCSTAPELRSNAEFVHLVDQHDDLVTQQLRQ